MKASAPKTGDLFASKPLPFRLEQWWHDSLGCRGARGAGVETYDQALALVKTWIKDRPLAAPGDFIAILDETGREIFRDDISDVAKADKRRKELEAEVAALRSTQADLGELLFDLVEEVTKLSEHVALLARLSPQHALYASGLMAVEHLVRAAEKNNIMDHAPILCAGCGAELGEEAYRRLPSMDLLCIACRDKPKAP